MKTSSPLPSHHRFLELVLWTKLCSLHSIWGSERRSLPSIFLVWKKYPWLVHQWSATSKNVFSFMHKKRQKGRFLRSVQKDSVVFFPRSTMIFTRFSGFPTWIRKDLLVFICLLRGNRWKLWWISLIRHNIKMSWNIYIIYITIYLTTQTLHHTKIRKSLKITINNKK